MGKKSYSNTAVIFVLLGFYFFLFFLNFECVFGFLLIFEQKHVLRHKCAIFEVFEVVKYDSFVA